MKILAIDSSAVVGSVALCEDEKLIGITTLNTGNTHSETLLVCVNELLSKAGWSVNDIELFACTNGPGSFTGIRIGVSVVKGMAFGRQDKCCAGVSTLEALAYNLTDREGVVCAVMDARRSQLYNALFRCDGKRLERLTPDRLISAKELDNELSQYNESVYFCGDGCKVALEAVKSDTVKYVNTFATYQSAYSVARLALEEYGRGRAVSDRELLPVYLRASQAERERLEKEKNREVNNNG